MDAENTSFKPLKGIVFDLDGTLVDSLGLTFDAFNHAIERLGGRRHTPHEIMVYFGTGEGEIFSKILGPEKRDPAYAMFSEYMDKNLSKVPLHAGVRELLDRLRDERVPISIFTGRSWPMTELILKHHGILDRFVTVVADDHVANPKPSPEGLHLALSRMKLEPAEVLFVGDSAMDIRAAHSAGSQGVAALWDLLAKREGLHPHHPHHWAEKPGQVYEIWQRLRA